MARDDGADTSDGNGSLRGSTEHVQGQREASLVGGHGVYTGKQWKIRLEKQGGRSLNVGMSG